MLPQLDQIFLALEWPHSIGSLYSPGMQLSFEETWRQEVTQAIEKKLGELDHRATELIELTMILTLAGHREGLVELLI